MAKQNIMFTMIFLQPFNKQGKLPCDYLKRGYEHERISTLCTQRFCFPFQ